MRAPSWIRFQGPQILPQMVPRPNRPRAILLQSRPMPTSTLLIVCGSWLALAVLAWVAYQFNRDRGRD